MNKRPYFLYYDGTADVPITDQVDHPTTLEFLPGAGANRRTIAGSDGNVYVVADRTVVPRGNKSIIWSSEGYTTNGVSIPALTTAQKKANGSAATNINAAISAGNVPSGMTVPTTLDFSPYRNLTLMLNLSALTGTSIQFEIDMLDDSGTPVSLALWKPAALTGAASVLVSIGPGVAFPQAATAPSTAATGFGAIAAPSGWTYYSIPLSFPPNGSFAWTVSSVTATSWTAFLYGSM